MGRFRLIAGFTLCWSFIVIFVLLILCSGGVSVAVAQSQPGGFLNIDCGATTTNTDPATGLTWVLDTPYITSGKTQALALPSSLQSFTELTTLRFFDNLLSKNCYVLPVVAGSIYLLRATFFYGNFDNANTAPSFQLAIDASILDNVTAPTGDSAIYREYHYVAQGNWTYFCLVRTSSVSTPFVSGISLKPAGDLISGFATAYGNYLQEGIIMKTKNRVNFGGTKLIRAPADFYDRFWFPEGPGLTPYYLTPTTSSYQFLATNSTFRALQNSSTGQPSIVMQTAVTTSSSGTLQTYLLSEGSTHTLASAYLAIEYAELNSSTSPLPLRNFSLQMQGSVVVPVVDLSGWTFQEYSWWNIWNIVIGADTTLTFTPLPGSEAGPILNSIEVFDRTDPTLSKTVDRDALAIEDIKTSFNLTQWTGDPCLPSPHSWVTCSTPVPTSSPQPGIIALNLSGYQLEGAIPDSIANLLDLTTLSLDNNNLSGPIPQWITTLAALRILSVQNNNLNGTIPDALLATNSKIRFTYRPGNPLLAGGGPLPSPILDCGKCGKVSVAAIIGAIVGCVVGLVLIVGIAILAYRRCKRKPRLNLSDNQGPGRLTQIATRGGAKAYTLAELTAATSNFNKKLGVGGFGPVYYGRLPDGQEVAVKVSAVDSRQGEKEFFNEVEVLSRVHHKNLVALVGYCQEQNQMLVYEYMHNGSLFDHLHGKAVKSGTLDWKVRLRIALNAAQGLEYLHAGCSPSFIHRDVKSGNILLTPQYDAKMSDFGLTKHLGEAEDTRVMTKVTGTLGYLDPEYYSTQYLSSKSDVYSFGIVLLELITGRLPIDHSTSMGTNPNIVHWVRENLYNNNIESILDPTVKASNPNIDGIWKIAEVAMQSVEPKGVHRPTITKVVQELFDALTLEGTALLPPLHSQPSSRFSSGSYAPTSLPTPR